MKTKLFKISRTIFINIFILIVLLLLFSFLLTASFQLYLKIKSIRRNSYARELVLPNYRGIKWAKQYYKEIGEVMAQYRSFIGWRRLPFKGQTINIDSNGIRVTPQDTLKDIKATYVAFLGGSTMWGTGVNDESTIPAFVAQSANGKFKVINLGEAGYTAFQESIFLQLQLLNGLRPDIIVSYDGVNNYFGAGRTLYGDLREAQIRDRLRGFDSYEPLSFEHLFEPFLRFGELVSSKFHPPKGDAYKEEYLKPLTPNELKQTAKELLESWLITKKLATQYGAQFIAVLQPNAGVGHPRLDYLNIVHDFKNMYAYYPYVFELMKEPRYRELTENFIDLTNVFDGNEYIYIDYCHASPNGNIKVAKRISNYILTKQKRNK